jgi:hypothetical membrane protein
MNYGNKKTAGSLIFVGVVQVFLVGVISEAVYTGYSVGQQYLSELGDWSKAGNFAVVWDVSVILMGLFVIAGAYFLQRGFKNRLFTSLLVIYGAGNIGAGVVAMNISLSVHTLFALVAMVPVAIAAIMSYRFMKSPLSYASVILGAVALLAIILLMLGQGNSDFYLGLGKGGIERFITYPVSLWLLGFGAYLVGDSNNTAITIKNSKL